MELIVNQTLQAQGHGQIRVSKASGSIYDAAFINSDFDPMALAEGIREAKSARLCLYGPPGTGKTAYGQWLAEQLGRPIAVMRSSDLDRGRLHFDEMKGVAFAPQDIGPGVEVLPNHRRLEHYPPRPLVDQGLCAGERQLRVTVADQVDAIRVFRLCDGFDHEPTIREELQILIFIEVRRILLIAIKELSPAIEAG